jgi:DNA-binding Lrp family transcriptional regulator
VALTQTQERIVGALQHGLPLTPRPYRDLGAGIGLDEQQVIDGIAGLLRDGIVKRLGVVVHHRALGFTANAMVVFDVADDGVDEVGDWLGRQDAVTLCYRRPRRPPAWPYNLFCMVHGRSHEEARARIQALRQHPRLAGAPYSVLFSTRCFKQRGARYRFDDEEDAHEAR